MAKSKHVVPFRYSIPVYTYHMLMIKSPKRKDIQITKQGEKKTLKSSIQKKSILLNKLFA